MMVPSVSRGPIAAAVLAASFLTVALVSRLPFRDTTLFISDSVRYALALEHYDMTLGRPHPPGNPLYIGAVATLDRFIGNEIFSFALFSAVMSGLAFLFAYLLGRDLAGETAGLLAAGILIVSPLFWYFGGLAMPSTAEAALSLVVAWLARRARAPHQLKAFWALTLLLAIGYGLRSTFVVLVFPLWIYASWWHPKRRILLGALVLVGAALGWTAIIAGLSGGWRAYQETSAAFFSDVVIATKLFSGGLAKIPRQIVDIGISAVLGLGLFLVPCAVGVYLCVKRRSPFPGANLFLGAWVLPALLFHAAYDWAPRFGVMLLPPAAILAATTAVPLARRLLEGRLSTALSDDASPMAHALVLFALAVNLAIFLLPVNIGPFTLPEQFPSGPRLLARNEDLARRDAQIRHSLDPERTLILAYPHTFHVAYFLPEYRVVGLFPAFQQAPDSWVPSAYSRKFSFEPNSSAVSPTDPIKLPKQIDQVLLYDSDYLGFWPNDEVPLIDFPYDVTRELKLANVSEGACIDFDYRVIQFTTARAGHCGAPRQEKR